LHGRSLKSSVDTRDRLQNLAKALGNPILRFFSVADFASYRKQRLDSGISEATLNRELSTLKALYRELKRLQLLDFDFPLLSVRKLKEKRLELTYLTKQDIKLLLEQVRQSTNSSLECTVKISLATGARWARQNVRG
jgi:site-specific recombinase XerD